MSEAVFFSDVNHQGKSAALGPGRHVLDETFNDTISSVRVPDGWTVTLFDGRDFDGESLELTSDAPSLSSGINDRTSSIVIADGGTPSQTAQVSGSAFTEIDQSNANVAVNFSELW
ncbi:peptidase inhibitor family I36 protein [Streptomyces sp. NPDC048248]|uniref:peptidase inhibitor family I36 protein n=1 Tax=Streptomyces sp. NPDC048248 TaxID=3365523 RepID=UPI0037131421